MFGRALYRVVAGFRALRESCGVVILFLLAMIAGGGLTAAAAMYGLGTAVMYGLMLLVSLHELGRHELEERSRPSRNGAYEPPTDPTELDAGYDALKAYRTRGTTLYDGHNGHEI